MTAEQQTPEAKPAEQQQQQQEQKPPETGNDRLPDDHPAALALKKANGEAEAARLRIKELEDAGKSETQRLTDENGELKGKLTTTEASALRLEVALEKSPDGTTPAQIRTLAKRLSGSTREEMEADAVELIKEFGLGGGKPPSFDGGARTAAGGGDMNALIRDRMKR